MKKIVLLSIVICSFLGLFLQNEYRKVFENFESRVKFSDRERLHSEHQRKREQVRNFRRLMRLEAKYGHRTPTYKVRIFSVYNNGRDYSQLLL